MNIKFKTRRDATRNSFESAEKVHHAIVEDRNRKIAVYIKGDEDLKCSRCGGGCKHEMAVQDRMDYIIGQNS